jgi:hypothetical protein
MRSIILLQSLAGSEFCFNAGTLLECSKAEAERFIDAGIARELLPNEPTELQQMLAGRMVAPVSQTTSNESQSVLPVANEPQPEPQRPRKRRS